MDRSAFIRALGFAGPAWCSGTGWWTWRAQALAEFGELRLHRF